MRWPAGRVGTAVLFAAGLVATAVGAAPAGADLASPALPTLVLVAPGTRVAGSATAPAPAGWSDLVIRTVTRIESGDVASLPEFAGATATLFHSVVLADVRPRHDRGHDYRLARVGLGLCVAVDGVDTVVDRESAALPPVSLGLVDRQVFRAADEELRKARLVARTETLAVVAAPSDLKVGGRHQRIDLFYAILVDPAGGRLRTLVWPVAAEPAAREAPAALTLLAPGLTFRCGLDVSAVRLLGALPVGWSFAMSGLPPGEAVAATPALRPWLADARRMAADPHGVERQLRASLDAR